VVIVGHQPEYLPYLGFFCKMALGDRLVLVDFIQFQKKGFQNRNYIRTRSGKLLLTVPVLSKGRFNQKINEVRISNDGPWARKHWKTILANYHTCPYFKDYAGFFEELYSRTWDRLVDLNTTAILYLMKCFGIEKDILFGSDYLITGHKTDMLVDLCRKLGADTYVSGWGARAYVDAGRFRHHNIRHRFLKFAHPVYSQRYQPFVPGVSAIDLLFNHGPEARRILAEAQVRSTIEES
jgi:hypothetical protein